MIKNESVLAIIPARGGSKGLPKKNIKELYGKPLIGYTIDAARKSQYVDRVVVSTDDIEIAEIAEKLGAEVPYIRPDELALDNSSVVDAILHMIDYLENEEKYKPKYICLLQCTSPLRNAEDIDNTISKMIKTSMEGAVSVCEVETNPYWTNVFKGDKLDYFLEEGRRILRRQDLPNVYKINGAIFVAEREYILNKKTLEPKNSTGYVMPNDRSIDIDSLLDFIVAESILKEKEMNTERER